MKLGFTNRLLNTVLELFENIINFCSNLILGISIGFWIEFFHKVLKFGQIYNTKFPTHKTLANFSVTLCPLGSLLSYFVAFFTFTKISNIFVKNATHSFCFDTIDFFQDSVMFILV